MEAYNDVMRDYIERGVFKELSQEEMDWLKDGLLASTACFKIILNSVPITDLSAMIGDGAMFDRWQGYPEERTEILGHIIDHEITGVLWVAGDVHYGMVGTVDPPGELAEHAWEVFVGPGGSPIGFGAAYTGDMTQYPVIVGTWSWTRFDCDPSLRTIRVRHIGDDGSTLSDITLQL